MCLMYDVEDSNLGGRNIQLSEFLPVLSSEGDRGATVEMESMREGKQKVGAAGVHGGGGERAVAAFTS